MRHWDQTPKEMVGLLHHAGTTYRVLGGCAPGPAPTPTTPGPAAAHPASNLAPGKCDLGNFAVDTSSAAGIAKCAATSTSFLDPLALRSSALYRPTHTVWLFYEIYVVPRLVGCC